MQLPNLPRIFALAAAALLGLTGLTVATPASAQSFPPCLSATAHNDVYVTPGETVDAPWQFGDCGAGPVTLTVRAVSWTGLAVSSPALGWVDSITPAQLTLQPGEWGTVEVEATVPAGTAPGQVRGQHRRERQLSLRLRNLRQRSSRWHTRITG